MKVYSWKAERFDVGAVIPRQMISNVKISAMICGNTELWTFSWLGTVGDGKDLLRAFMAAYEREEAPDFPPPLDETFDEAMRSIGVNYERARA